MKTILLTAGIALAASTAQAQSLQCHHLTAENVINREVPPLFFRLDPLKGTAEAGGRTIWMLTVEADTYVLARKVADNLFHMITITRDSGQAVSFIAQEGKEPQSLAYHYCTKADRL